VSKAFKVSDVVIPKTESRSNGPLLLSHPSVHRMDSSGSRPTAEMASALTVFLDPAANEQPANK